MHCQGLERPYQVVHRTITTPFHVRDLSRYPVERRTELVTAELGRERAQGFELNRAPLVRLRVFQLDSELHQVVFSYHHILLDGWSLPIVTGELLLEYEGAAADARLPGKTADFAAFIRWQAGRDAQAADRHWRDRLRGLVAPSPTGLGGGPRTGSDGPDSAGQSSARVKLGAVLARDKAEALRRAARGAGVTLGTVALGAWALALSALSGRRDVVFGVTSSGRERGDGLARVVGMCLSTLPFRTQVSGSMQLADWLRGIQRAQRADRQFEHTALAEVKRHSALAPGVALFDSIVVFGNTPLGELHQAAGQLSGLELVEVGQFEKTNYPLTLLISPRDGLSIEALAAATADPDEVRRLVELLVTILAGMATGFEQRVVEVPLSRPLTPDHADRPAHSTEGVGETPGPQTRPDDTPLDAPDLLATIADRAVQTPEAIAVQRDDRALTYGELARRSDRLAEHLHTIGAAAEARIGIACQRGAELIIALLGVLKAGAVCVPLDPGQPARRQAYILARAGALAVLADRDRASALVTDQVVDETPVVIVEEVCGEPNGDAATAQRAADRVTRAAGEEIVPERLAYLLFTSGSTGEPKGVAMPRRSLDRLVAWQNRRSRRVAAAAADAWAPTTMQLAAIGFDVAFQEVFSTLAAGGRLVMVDEQTRRDPAAILDIITRERVSRIFVPFVMLEALASAAAGAEKLPTDLREIITAGEQLKITPALRSLMTRLSDCTLDNQYGPTESHVVTAHQPAGEPDSWPLLPPIGRALPGTRTYVLDPLGRALPAGLSGELYLAGDGLARGYLGRPAATAERFVPDPFAPEPGARMYRTGDLVRADASGILEFIGRNDAQVKIRGYRVELGEIEAAAADHAGIAAAAATVRRASPDSEARLALYVVATPAATADDSALATLRQHLAEHLPPYMMPHTIQRMAALPLTASGKVDRRAL
ncbi:MAG: amino acid adenylation domain-containing protein, partial [Myxococcota bacterium]